MDSQLQNVVLQQVIEILFSSSEDDSDDDYDLLLVGLTQNIPSSSNRLPKLHDYVELVVPLYSNEQFKSHFRMLPETFEFILEIISPKLVRIKPGYESISPKTQLLIAIWKMATPDSYRSICEKFGVSQSSALNAVRRVTNALVNLAPKFIVWPDSDRALVVRNGFSSISSFPNIVGAIDGTHINIPAPHKHPETYVNRKGHHSIQLQAVCDYQCRFIHCYVGNVGSVHDQRVFRLSEVHDYMEDSSKFENNSHIIGDAAYKINEHLLVPYRDNGHLTLKQKNFNFCLSSARMAIERSFGLLKGRFRSLLTTLDMERVDLIPTFILACCVLHNICLLKGDELPNFLEIEPPKEINDHEPRGECRNRLGLLKREQICEELPIII